MPERYTRTEVGIDVDLNPWRASRLIGIFTIILLVGGIAAWVLSWQRAALDTIGPARMLQLSREANDRWQALQGQQATVALGQQSLAEFEALYGVDRTKWPQGKREEYQQLRTQVGNLITAYNLSCSQYNALWGDAWRDLPAPDDLPRSCPLMTAGR